MMRARHIAGAMVIATSACVLACSSGREGLDPSTLPEGVRADYQVLAQRCSKCHSLARVFNAGFSDDESARRYVERMRRQPQSGISVDDEVPILRFLHYWIADQAKKKAIQHDQILDGGPVSSLPADGGR